MILEVLNQRIIRALENNQVPWRGRFGFPANAVTRQSFDGFAALVLNVASLEKEYQSRFWASAAEWRAMGAKLQERPGHVRPEEWGTEFVSSGEQFLPQTMFNLDQIDGYFYQLRTDFPSANYTQADKFVADTGAKIVYKAGMECYYWNPPMDRIIFPLREQLERGGAGRVGYYHTMFHELMHWTQPRVGWTCREEPALELRAEIGADFLCSIFGLPHMVVKPFRKTHMRYLGKWIDMMRKNPAWIVWIANEAAKGMEFLLQKKPEQKAKVG